VEQAKRGSGNALDGFIGEHGDGVMTSVR